MSNEHTPHTPEPTTYTYSGGQLQSTDNGSAAQANAGAGEASAHTQPTQPLSQGRPVSGITRSNSSTYPHVTDSSQVHPAYRYAPAPSSGGTGQPPHGSTAFGDGPQRDRKPKRAPLLVTGLLIGALVGGVAGGGTAAFIANDSGSQPSASTSSSGAIKLENIKPSNEVAAIAAARTPSVVTLEVATSSNRGSGSGVIIRKDGYIVTNAHVVTLDGATKDAKIRARLSDGRLLNAKLVGMDPYADLAVVKVESDNLPTIDFADSNKIAVGDTTIAIGAPLDLPSTVTTGVVSAVNRGIAVGSSQVPDNAPQDTPNQESPFGMPWEFDNGQGQDREQQQSNGTVTLPVVQTDASINPGNSGGALLDGSGNLIGINVAIASTGNSQTAGSVGLGFAVPANLAKRVVNDLIDGKTPSHGLLGASVADATQDANATHAGGVIAEVQKGSPAEKAGLRKGDVITEVNGVPAADGTSVSALIRMAEGGSDAKIAYSRGGEDRTTEVTLGTLK